MAKPSMSMKSKSMEMEPGEGKKHEMAETEQEELREGAEPDDMPAGKTNRKRSAKGTKNTKAPLDGEGCSCGARKGTASCDGNCGSYAKKMDRNDALTPQEYLAACDLGIQGRSRSYIRARLDAAARLDLKCGKGSISQGEKCSKGTATRVQAERAIATKGRIPSGWTVRKQTWGERFGDNIKTGFGEGVKSTAKVGAVVGGVTGLAAGGPAGGVGGALAGAAVGGTLGAVSAPLGAAIGATFSPPTSVLERKRGKRRDSVYAPGFSVDYDQLAL
jgi:hypothetical protein